jgi:hypothetical protein
LRPARTHGETISKTKTKQQQQNNHTIITTPHYHEGWVSVPPSSWNKVDYQHSEMLSAVEVTG